MVRREDKRRLLIDKHKARRQELRKIIGDPNTSLDEKFDAQRAMQSLPKDSNRCRRQNRCWITGRAHGVYRFVGLCRNMFRIHAMHGDIPGLHKASW
jgi:small subunit ribosomal protein S14